MSETVETRADYPVLATVQTRWSDNDVYGHVNNVTYYSYFDTVVNNYLIEQGGLDIADGRTIGLVVESMCRFRASVAYPDKLTAGLRVGKLGTSSVRYEIGIFRDGEDQVAAWGHFVHVFVDRGSNRPTPIPAPMRAALDRITIAKEAS